MKAKFNLSQIMTNAHQLFKGSHEAGQDVAFGYCLREAWKAAKRNMGRVIEMCWMWDMPCAKVQPISSASIMADYNSGANGRKYFGD